jgi:hypothetical protein
MEYAAFRVPISQEAMTAVTAVPPEAKVLTRVNWLAPVNIKSDKAMVWGIESPVVVPSAPNETPYIATAKPILAAFPTIWRRTTCHSLETVFIIC